MKGVRLEPPTPSVRVLAEQDAVATAAATGFIARARMAIAARNRFAVALSGGSTPAVLFRELARRASEVDWGRAHVFWGDERAVPPDHRDSNYRLARELLLDPAGVPSANVHRIHGEEEPSRAAAAYEDELRRFFSLAARELPRFDLVFLGMGDNGHTASLFPHSAALSEHDRLAVATVVDADPANRITLTLPVLNHAACVAFLVTGAGKAAMLQRVIEGPERPEELPAQAVRPLSGQLCWIVDGAAAAYLEKPVVGPAPCA